VPDNHIHPQQKYWIIPKIQQHQKKIGQNSKNHTTFLRIFKNQNFFIYNHQKYIWHE